VAVDAFEFLAATGGGSTGSSVNQLPSSISMLPEPGPPARVGATGRVLVIQAR
jgi:hypothetical protein